jgi:hypothetical protein
METEASPLHQCFSSYLLQVILLMFIVDLVKVCLWNIIRYPLDVRCIFLLPFSRFWYVSKKQTLSTDIEL